MTAPKNSGFLLDTDPTGPAGKATPFRDLIPAPDHPRIKGIASHDAYSWCESRRQIEAPAWLINRLDKKNVPEFVGFTSDGKPTPELFVYGEDEGSPTGEMVEAAEKLLAGLSEKELDAVNCGSLMGDEFRIWSNPELYVNPGGIRLDESSSEVQDLIHGLLRASTSEVGYAKILGCCLTNEFLGQLVGPSYRLKEVQLSSICTPQVNGPKVLNKHSYNFRLFEKPSLTEPWGFTFFGHHLCLAVVVVGKRYAQGPNFFAAEPDHIDEGPNEGLRLFAPEEVDGLALVRSLSPELLAKAQESKSLTEVPDWNPFDERHVGGAQQDNRVVPYAGCPVSLFNADQKKFVMRIFASFHETLPEGPLAARLALIEKHLDETYFLWYGEFGDDDAFYYRLHSPVAFVEFDFHCGIFLSNTSPSKCHVHTVVRNPNGADYGRALLAQYEKERAGQ
ncbi:putative gtp binding protein and negative regulator of the ran tc4 gtpase cycle gtr1p protein [Pseudohyphozyma bogoriensis]|nr:putative gtp binding protein and negative regulator of the ran tc4 gtpase cycle gtr1p protein [Pseudohyphozyma bogoriensis]